MIRWLLHLLSAFLVGIACCLPALAQDKPEKPPLAKVGPGEPPGGIATSGDGAPTPVAEFAVAIILTLLILTVVCMPSRKR